MREQEQLQAEEAAAAAPSEAAAAAAAADVNDTDQEGITEGEEQELEELVECSNDDDDALQDWQADAAAGSDSDVGSTSDGIGSEYSDNDGDAEAAAAAPKQKPQKQQPQKGKKQQKEKKPRKKRPSTRRLCVTFAKAQYRLTEADLQQLTDVVYEPNPHYPGGHRMRLYLVRELEELARAKEERQALLANTKEQRAAERAAATKARKAAAAAAAAEAAQRFTLQPQKEGRHGSLQLPDTCLTNVMACLASTLQPGGLRGPSCVAKELAQASLVCWDFYHAAKHGFTALAEAASSLQQLPPPDDLPDDVLQGPAGGPATAPAARPAATPAVLAGRRFAAGAAARAAACTAAEPSQQPEGTAWPGFTAGACCAGRLGVLGQRGAAADWVEAAAAEGCCSAAGADGHWH